MNRIFAFIRTALATFVAAALLSLGGCSSTRHVPQDEYLLDRAYIEVEGDKTVETAELYNFLRQQPNHKVLGFAKLQLATYSLSGQDTTKWYNRWLRSLGQPPVIFDEELTETSRRQLRQALINKGYMDVTVTADTVARPSEKKMDVHYRINTGRPHTVSKLNFDIANDTIRRIILADSALFTVGPGDIFDRNALDNQRVAIAERMRNMGYYSFSREDIRYIADTVAGQKEVELTLVVDFGAEREDTAPSRHSGAASASAALRAVSHSSVYYVKRVIFVTDEGSHDEHPDTVQFRNISVVYGSDRYIHPSTLYDMCFIEPGKPYSSAAVDRTYESLSRLSILRFINIEMRSAGELAGVPQLDAVIVVSRNRKQSISVEVEGTNSEGDLGFGIGATYQHRNLSHRSELLTMKLRTSYESLSGNFEGLVNNRYTEYAGEAGITFPKFKCPFVSKAFKKRMRATTELTTSFNYQERPEYTRIIVGAGWRWKWSNRKADLLRRHTVDLVDVNYVRLPRSTINFIDEIAPTNPLLRYSYEDHFIMRTGYTFYRSNRRIPTATMNAFAIQPSVTTIRAAGELAGNLLYAASALSGMKREDGAYKILGIQYAQYVKAEFDYTYTRNLTTRQALSFHSGFGIAVPYGNSRMVPFEKRFYAGGANGVRGWGVRTLGPGCYDARNSVTDFINQCGDISLVLSAEYRAKLFWVFEGAVFVDAGNIWTIHNYPNQPGGMFHFDSFYRQLAAAYGVGLRMDFTYFLLRLDLGFKAHNPAMNQEKWPIVHPKWSRDANFHFAVGYPF